MLVMNNSTLIHFPYPGHLPILSPKYFKFVFDIEIINSLRIFFQLFLVKAMS